MDGCGDARREVDELRPFCQAPARSAATPTPSPARDPVPGGGERGAHRHRAEDPRSRHGHHLRRSHRSPVARGPDLGAGRGAVAGDRARHTRRHDREHGRDPRGRGRLRKARVGAAPRAGPLRSREPPCLVAGIHLDRGRAAGDAATAFRSRGQVAPPPVAVLRPTTSWRDSEPRHQRHRQHHPMPAADAEPAAHVAPHGRGCHRHDVRGVTAALPHRVGGGAVVGRRDPADRETLAEAVHRAVDPHRHVERPHRGVVHRTRAGQGLRSAA